MADLQEVRSKKQEQENNSDELKDKSSKNAKLIKENDDEKNTKKFK